MASRLADRNLETAPSSSIYDDPPNACQRIQGCLLKLVGRAQPNALSPAATPIAISSSVPPRAPPQAPLQPPVKPLQTSMENATLNLWIRDACNIHSSLGNQDLQIHSEVGSACFSTQVFRRGQGPAWVSSRKFSFKLGVDATEVLFKLSTPRDTCPLAMALLPIPFCVSGKTTSFRLGLTSRNSDAVGEIIVDACLVMEGSLTYEIDSYVQVLGSNKKWESAIVKEFTEQAKMEESKGKTWEVEAGSVKVQKSNGRRWLAPKHHSVILKRPCDWICTHQRQELPEFSYGGDVCIGRNEMGEIGRIATVESDKPGQFRMESFSCYGREADNFTEALVINPGFAVSWRKIKKGNPVPICAVQCSLQSSIADQSSGSLQSSLADQSSLQASANRYFCVGRSEGRVGSLMVLEDGGVMKMDQIRCYDKAGITEGEVLVVEPALGAYREFDVEIHSLENLGDPAYRIGDLSRKHVLKREYKPYVQVKVVGAAINGYGTSWLSNQTPNICNDDFFAWHEHMRLAVGGKLADVQLHILVFNQAKTVKNVLKDSEFGEHTMLLTEQSLGRIIDVDLQRKGESRGTLKIHLRELPRSWEGINEVPLINTLPVPARLIAIQSNMFIDRLCQDAGNDNEYKTTLRVCWETLSSTNGGILVFVRGENQGATLSRTDTRLGLDASDVRCDNDKRDRFMELLNTISTSTSPAETWTEHDLAKFNFSTNSAEQAVQRLSKKPKGGCIEISKSGEIEDVAANFEFHGCCPYRFPVADGQSLEARHCMAIRIVHWLSCKRSAGAVFARWETGTSRGDIFVAVPSKVAGDTPDVFVLSEANASN